MKWRHWSILIVLVLLNYIIFSTAFTQLAKQRNPGPGPTRTPLPTYEIVQSGPVGWIVLPTSTPRPTRTPITSAPVELAPAVALTATQSAAIPTVLAPTEVPATPTVIPSPEFAVHVVQSGETLSQIAEAYGVAVEDLLEANGLADPDLIDVGQELRIPVPGSEPLTATPKPTSKPAAPKPTKRPPTATPAPTVRTAQFTAQIVWDPLVAPNCAGPGISKESMIRDAGGNPINGVRVQVDCYGNVWLSHASGIAGEYDSGHYDFGFGQNRPQDWTCTARVFDIDGQPVASSEAATIHFDTNDCKPGGAGHQIAIVNWTKRW